MKLKSVEKIRDEYFDNDRKLSQESLDTLKKYLEGKDVDKLCRAISLVTDARLMQFVPLMAKHLDHEDDYVRELLIGDLLTILELPEYAKIGLKMAQEDEASGVRCLALSSIGNALPFLTDQELKINIANYLLKIVVNEDEDNLLRRDAYEGIMTGAGLSHKERMSKPRTLRRSEDLDLNLLEKFKEMYGLKAKPRQKLKSKERNKKPKV